MSRCRMSGKPVERLSEPGEYDQCIECGRVIRIRADRCYPIHNEPTEAWQRLYSSRLDAQLDGWDFRHCG